MKCPLVEIVLPSSFSPSPRTAPSRTARRLIPLARCPPRELGRRAHKGSRTRIRRSVKNSQKEPDMRRISHVFVLSVGAVVLIATVAGAGERVAVLDECDPATFNALPPVGPGLGTICDMNFNGDVTFAEFLSLLPPGHLAWRNEPSWLE